MMKDISLKSGQIRRLVLELAYEAQTGHIGSALSCVEILISLYYNILRFDPRNPDDPHRDRFILSKGHAALSLYAILHELGIIPLEQLKTYCRNSTELWGHPNRAIRGIEFTTGSLGHGLGVAAGIAYAARLAGGQYRAYALLSDGECNEGSTGEAAALVASLKLPVVAIIDYNNIQATDLFSNLSPAINLKKLWEALGWTAVEADGHDIDSITAGISDNKKKYPLAVIAKTVKGKGVSFMENDIEWHYKRLNADMYNRALEEINAHAG